MRAFKKSLLLLAATLVAMLGLLTPAMAAESPNLLVMGEDFDKDTVPRDSRIFRRVLASVANQLGDDGYDVYDETAITFADFKQGRTRRSDAEMIDIARSITRPPIDIVVFFSIYASAEDKGYETDIFTRIEGRLLDVRSGRRLGNFEVSSPRSWSAKSPCPRECVLETVGDASKTLANDLGDVLSEKLEAIVGKDEPMQRPGESNMVADYSLIFDNFSADEMMEIEEYLVDFSGYITHRPTYQSATRSEIWYKTDSRATTLSRNLNKMLDAVDMNARVQFADGTFKVQRVTLRGKKRRDPAENDW